MNSPSQRHPQQRRSFLSSNPIMRRLENVHESDANNASTYGGITLKTIFFLLFSVVGMIAQSIVSNSLSSGNTFDLNFKGFEVALYRNEVFVLLGVVVAGVVFQLVALFARSTVPVTGALYSITQGYFISFLIFKVLGTYHMEYLGALALGITVLIVLVMSILYSTGVIRVTKKFRMVMLTLLITTIAASLFSFIGYLIPFTRPLFEGIRQNFALSVVSGVIFIVIAALFLICDFDTIDHVVHDKLPKKYEWQAAFGLSFTVLWLYLKVLDLIITIAGRNNSNSK